MAALESKGSCSCPSFLSAPNAGEVAERNRTGVGGTGLQGVKISAAVDNWADSASAHEERGLKHRAPTETRPVRIPPELVRMLRDHIETFGTAATAGCSAATVATWWHRRRSAMCGLRPGSCADAGTGGISLDGSTLRPSARGRVANGRMRARVPLQEVERAGHSMDVLLRVYAKCLDGGETAANKRIERTERCLERRHGPGPRRHLAIPRISGDIPNPAASGGIWLHASARTRTPKRPSELRFRLAVGPEFETREG